MNIKVAALTVSEKSSNIKNEEVLLSHDTTYLVFSEHIPLTIIKSVLWFDFGVNLPTNLL